MCWKKSGYALKIIDLSARSRLPNVVRGRKTVARNNLYFERGTKEDLQVTDPRVAQVFKIHNDKLFKIHNDKLFNKYSTDILIHSLSSFS